MLLFVRRYIQRNLIFIHNIIIIIIAKFISLTYKKNKNIYEGITRERVHARAIV